MTSKTNIDLVVRFKNEEYWLNYFVKAISSQIGVEINAIGIDNNSTDRSAEIFSSLSTADCISSLNILNLDTFLPGQALNIGANAGKSPYIVNISSHCIPKLPTYLIELIQELETEDDRCVGAFGAQLPLRCSGAQNTIDLVLTYPREERIFRRTPIFNNANSIIKRNIFNKFQFDKDVTNLEDVIWAKTVLEKGYELKYTPKGEVYHFHGPHQHIHFSGRAEKSLEVLLSKNWISIDKPKFLDITEKNILLIEKFFEPEISSFIGNITRGLRNGKFDEFNFTDTTLSSNQFDHLLWTSGLSDNEIINFATECSEMATEASYLDANNNVVYCEFLYGKSPINSLLKSLMGRKNVYISSRVARLLLKGKENA
jgi:glycosyltransferase involved in cell wall biosynthesis